MRGYFRLLKENWPLLVVVFLLGVFRKSIFTLSSKRREELIDVKYQEVNAELLKEAKNISSGILSSLGTRKGSFHFFEDEKSLKHNLDRIIPELYNLVDDYYKIHSLKNRSMEEDISRLLSAKERIMYVPKWIRTKYGYGY